MILYLVALAPEAEPLIRYYRMEPFGGVFRWYRSEETALVVSGIGKLAAAAAASYLHGKTGEKSYSVWLNVGIAGHRDRPVGDVLIAHTVTDAATGERFYPARLDGPRLDAVEVKTVDRAETELGSDAAYDMEAYGFCRTALRFSTSELVQSIKIVSDNRETSARAGWTAVKTRELVEGASAEIVSAASRFQELSTELDGNGREREIAALLASFSERCHFTASEARKLRRLLLRWRALDPEAAGAVEELPDATGASEILRRLESKLEALAMERPL
ncbi:MAG: hypothetical protein ACRD21_12730 [Vicinamibacteria bacterium]